MPSSKPAPSHPNHGQRPYQERSIEIDSKGTEEEENCVRNTKQKKPCPICQKEMDEKSISRHCRTMHQEEITPQSVYVDEKKGIFMVRKSMNGGVAFPIHVRKMNSNGVCCDGPNIFCENEPCRTYMNVAWRSGMPAAECHHLRNVATHSVYQKELNPNK